MYVLGGHRAVSSQSLTYCSEDACLETAKTYEWQTHLDRLSVARPAKRAWDKVPAGMCMTIRHAGTYYASKPIRLHA